MNEENIEVLDIAGSKEGAELGEYWSLLSSISKYTYLMTDDFEKALILEVEKESDRANQFLDEDYQCL